MKQNVFATKSLFLFEPRNRPFVDGTSPRYHRSAAGVIALILVFGGILIAGIVMLYFAFQEMQITSELEKNGVNSQATITYREAIKSDDSTDYRVRYTYQVNGLTFQNSQNVTETAYNQLVMNSRANIRYLPKQPTTARLMGIDTNQWVLPVLGAAFCLIGCVALGAGVFFYQRSKRRERLGRVVFGELTSVRQEDDDGTIYMQAHYQFINPGNEIVTGSCKRSNYQFKEYGLPPIGTAIALLYLNDHDYEII